MTSPFSQSVVQVRDRRTSADSRETTSVGNPSGRRLLILVPVLILLAGTMFFRFSIADVTICRWFFDGPELGWIGNRMPVCMVLYWYGDWPAYLLGFGGLSAGCIAYWKRPHHPSSRKGFFLAATVLLGPAIIVNTVKNYWGRPRPREIVEFGGASEFQPVLNTGLSGRNASFPSGHAAAGFCLMAPMFLFRHRRRRIAVAFLVTGLTAGSVMGLARIAQGAHFPSDVLWSFGIVFYTSLAMACVFRLDRGDHDRAQHPGSLESPRSEITLSQIHPITIRNKTANAM